MLTCAVQHLLMAIKLGADQLIEPLLQAGGMSMLLWEEAQESGDPPMAGTLRGLRPFHELRSW